MGIWGPGFRVSGSGFRVPLKFMQLPEPLEAIVFGTIGPVLGFKLVEF